MSIDLIECVYIYLTSQCHTPVLHVIDIYDIQLNAINIRLVFVLNSAISVFIDECN